MINRIKWMWIKFWGWKYRVKYTNELKENEILCFRHTLYIGTNQDKRRK